MTNQKESTMKKTLVNLKGKTLYVLLPVMLMSCESKQEKINAELADVNARLDKISVQVDSANAIVAKNVADSVANSKMLANYGSNIAKYKDALGKPTAQRDSTYRNKVTKHLNRAIDDSTYMAGCLKDKFQKAGEVQFADMFREYNALVAKRESLLKQKQK